METRLKAARQALGWSQLRLISELEALGASRRVPLPTRESLKTQLSRWENGHVTPQEPYTTLLSDIFGVTPDELGLDGGGVADHPVPLSRESIGGYQALLGQFVQVDNTVGPQRLFELATKQVSTLEPTLIGARGRVRQDGLELCSRFAEFAGWLGQDAGDLDGAERWTDLAMDFAEEVGDPETRAYVLMRKSNIAAERHEHGRALTLTSASCRDIDRVSPPVRALTLRQTAISHALVRDHRRSERAAELALEVISDEVDGGGGFDFVTPAYVLMETGTSAYFLRRYDVAATRLATALDQWPAGFVRDRAPCLARLSMVEATRGNVDAACAVGQDALAAYRAAGSARVRATWVSLKQRLAPYERSAAVSELRRDLARLK
ncbi:hypothetical protein AB3X52_08885 [Nocardioides sp. DS6]|uniref:HTH cro/C1-type domain-containing protein n=1 Tax=Nocardioides eburneus TaxID=3231482 RepID=A0ABV3SXQ9_9ACTN